MCRCCSACCFCCSICCAKCGGKANVIDLSKVSTPQSNGDSNGLPKASNIVKMGQNLASVVVDVVWKFFIQFQKCAFINAKFKNFGCEILLSNQPNVLT